MSATDLSYQLTEGSTIEKQTQVISVTKYLDIDSTYRNRNNYPNPNDFVIPITYPGRDSTSDTAIDPIIDAIPYTASLDPPGLNQIQAISGTSVTLDPNEIDVDNYYVNSYLEINGEFRKILSYDGSTKLAVIETEFTAFLVSAGDLYYTRKNIPIFIGTVQASPSPTFNTISINGFSSTVNDIYVNSYVRFTSGSNSNRVFRIKAYDGLKHTITIDGVFSTIPSSGDTLELNSFSRDNASALFYSNSGSSVNVHSYYEIELLWLSVPNQVLGVGYGGTLDRYPYVYVRLYNEGNRLANQVLLSNNPNSTLVTFKVPVDQYFGNTSFITLTNSKTKQIIRFDPQSDIRFTVTLPDGSIVDFANKDNLTPLNPDPFLQVNALFSIRKM